MNTDILTTGAAFTLGFTFGAGACNIACLPYLGPVFFATEGGVKKAWRNVTPFSLGRLSGYTIVGALAGALGALLDNGIEQQNLRWFLGASTIWVAASIIIGQRKAHKPCALVKSNTGKRWLPSGLFFMGLGMAFNPCAPLNALLLAAAASGNAVNGAYLGLAFGAGAVILPSIIFAVGVAYFAAELKLNLGVWKTYLESISVGLLILMGVGTALGWITP